VTPAARLEAAIEILGNLGETHAPVDRFLRDWFRARRYAGSKDRANVGERVFTILRRKASLGYRMSGDNPRALVIASLLAEGKSEAEIDTLFDGSRYAPAQLSNEERASLRAPPHDKPPLHVQGDFPAFLENELHRAFGEDLLSEMLAMCERAPIDLRVNTLKASRDDVLATLQADGYATKATLYSPHGIRIPAGEGLSSLSRHPAFESGLFEFQNEAAQIASLLADPKPGMRVLDLASGAGGKALALAAEMQNKGEIIAADTDSKRLAQIAPRAARAGAMIIYTHHIMQELPRGPFDIVFVDAPCSGSGTWRRQPELKWRISQKRIEELNIVQDSLLDQAASQVMHQGHIVYATCSVLPSENEDRITRFLQRHPGFTRVSAAERAASMNPAQSIPGVHDLFRASPYLTRMDGFFVSILMRTEPVRGPGGLS
jgi:16S rRNA (cytosine967-C5)-methyltransferase